MILLDAQNVSAFAQQRGWIGPGPAEAEELSGGVSNAVFRVQTPTERIVVKQSRPRLRTQREWFSDPERIFREEAVQRLLAERLPGSVPEVRGSDHEHFAYAMQHAPLEARPWKAFLLEGHLHLETAQRAGQLLARLHDLDISMINFLEDSRIFEQLRAEPFYDRLAEQHTDLSAIIRNLRYTLTHLPIALCHGDYSPKNLLVTDETLLLVDHETALLGEPAMDVGFFFSHLLLKAFRKPAWRQAMLGLIGTALGGYRSTARPRGDLLERAIGHLGVCLLARIDGTSPVEYLPDEATREAVRQFARQVLLEAPNSWEDVIERASTAICRLELG
ncbi:MAG: aminoglycoside phosphotransferase family protein [Gemmataceae bacterium]